jgi:hypothetical protein
MKEIIAIIDEMIEEQRELALFWHPTEERYIAERYEDAISISPNDMKTPYQK